MNTLITTTILLSGIVIGSVAGHYHGKAEVYASMFESHALVAEALND